MDGERYGRLEQAAERMLLGLFGIGLGQRYVVAEEMLAACSKQESVYRILVEGIERAAQAQEQRDGRLLDSEGWARLAATTTLLMGVMTLDERTKDGLRHAITRTFIPQDTTIVYRNRGIVVGNGLRAAYRLLEEAPVGATEEQLRERRRAQPLRWFLEAPSAAQIIDSGLYDEIFTLASLEPGVQVDFFAQHRNGPMKASVASGLSPSYEKRVGALVRRLARKYPLGCRVFEDAEAGAEEVAADARRLAEALV